MGKGKLRPPIVTVLGHVDHGKTTLLDAIRKTGVAAKEAGGITQSIGASVVKTKEGEEITFIDTPGHAAFSKMRSRGAEVADMAILVVAADDGVKPQTKEALSHIKKAKIPFIVSATKMDLSSANVKALQGQLEKESIKFEGKGGEVPLVEVSAKENKGLEDLLEIILLVSEVNEIKADKEGELEAVVIETGKDKRGVLVSIVVRSGTLKVGEKIVAEDLSCKVRGLFDDKGESKKEIFPGKPAQVLGFSSLPPIGAKVGTLKKEEKVVPEPKVSQRKVGAVEKGKIPVVFKAKSAGSLEAVLENLPERIVVVAANVGDVNESDVFLARGGKDTYIFTFGSKVPKGVRNLADEEGVSLESFEVIYELLERLEELVKGREVKILGQAEISATFPYNNKKVAGCKVISGRITKSDTLALMREERRVGFVKPVSMRKQKEEITEAKTGEEFGIIFKPELDFDKGDMLVSVKK